MSTERFQCSTEAVVVMASVRMKLRMREDGTEWKKMGWRMFVGEALNP